MNQNNRQCYHRQDLRVATIESLAQDGRGVAHLEGKATFIHGALPGELVQFSYEKIQKRFDEGRAIQILEASPARVIPKCPHFGVCGGCSLQHLQGSEQIKAKEQILKDALEHLGKVTPLAGYLPPLVAELWGYRSKARLGVKYVQKKGQLLLGFRERNSPLVTNLECCEVLNPKIGLHLPALRETIARLSIYTQIPQIELAMGDSGCVLVLRVLTAPSLTDLEQLRQFAAEHELAIYLQPGGPDSLIPVATEENLSYNLSKLKLQMQFLPLDFTQVNLPLNRLLVDRVLELLNPQLQEKILDLFCGIGNFTLPLATQAGLVTGVEGDLKLVTRAKNNAEANKLNNCRFYATDLYTTMDHAPWLNEQFDQVLLDPPRSGALQVLPYLRKIGARRILYISCFPATLARDAGVLVHELGYNLRLAGVMDMFPHTAHVESLALFDKPE